MRKRCKNPKHIRRTYRNGQSKCVTCKAKAHYRRLFGIEGIPKNQMCEMEGCLRKAKAIDHDHSTGLMRGFLCRGCNVRLGILEHEPFRQRVNKYLSKEKL